MGNDSPEMQSAWWLKCLPFSDHEPMKMSDLVEQVSGLPIATLPNVYLTESEACNAARKFLLETKSRLEADLEMLSRPFVASTDPDDNNRETWIQNRRDLIHKQYAKVERILWLIAGQ